MRKTQKDKSILKKQVIDILITMVIIGVFSLIMAIVSLYYSVGNYGMELFWSYLKYKKLIFFHFLPVFCISSILFFTTNRLDFSCGFTGTLVLLLTWINYFKLKFRDDPFLFSDFFIVSEAKNMVGEYNITLTAGMVACIFVLLLVIAGLHFIKRKINVK